MGNKSTSAECLDQLGITASSHRVFKEDVLDFLQERRKCEFSILEDDEIPTLVKDYVRSANFGKWKPYTQKMSQSSDSRYRRALEQLVQIWIEDKRRQESQDDPSYTSKGSKKRKRNGEQIDGQRTISSFLSPNHRAESNFAVSTSASVSSDENSLDDIDHHNSDDGSLPDASALIANRNSRENTHRPQQRQTQEPASALASISDPSSPETDPIRMPPQSATRAAEISAIDTQTTPVKSTSSIRTPESMRQRVPPELGSPRSFHEEIEQVRSLDQKRPSMIELEDNGRESATVRAASDGFESLYTPPPTIRRPAFIKTKDYSFSADHLGRFKKPREDSDAWELLDDIVGYIEACENHSICIEQNPDSSPEQVQKQRIRAQVFTNLKSDIESRIKAKMDDDGVKGKTPIRNYCLWSGSALDPS